MSNEKEPAVGREAAEAEFERFVDAMDLDLDQAAMDKEDGADFAKLRETFVRAVMAGRVTVNDAGEPTVRLADGSSLTFKEPTGGTFMAADGKGKNDDVRKMFAIMGAMTGTGVPFFSKIANRDLKVCQAIATLFLA